MQGRAGKGRETPGTRGEREPSATSGPDTVLGDAQGNAAHNTRETKEIVISNRFGGAWEGLEPRDVGCTNTTRSVERSSLAASHPEFTEKKAKLDRCALINDKT